MYFNLEQKYILVLFQICYVLNIILPILIYIQLVLFVHKN